MCNGKIGILCFLLFLTGCSDSKDPEDRAYVITMGIEKTADSCLFTFAPADTGGGADLFFVKGDTLSAAVAEAECRSSREVYLGQLKNIVFGKSLLEDKEAFGSILDELERSVAVSEKVMVLGTKDSAASCVEIIGKADSSTGLFLWEFYKNTAEEVAVTRHVDLDTWLTDLRTQGNSGILPAISLEEGHIVLGGGIAFSEGVYDFSLCDEQERNCLLLTGYGKGAVLTEEIAGIPMTVEIRKNRVSYDFQRAGEKPVCMIHVHLQGALTGSGGKSVSSPKQRQEIEELFAARIKSHLENTIKVVQQQAAGDILGLCAAAERKTGEKIPCKTMEAEVLCEFSLGDTGRIR